MPRLSENCIWCEEPTDDSDLSHVLPECFGNRGVQVLPKGTVCRSCNNYFGSKIEPALVEDPMIHAICVTLRVVDPGDANVFRDRLFDQQHRAMTRPQTNLGLNLTVRADALELEVSYEVKGVIRREYERRWVARFLRAIHKVAFESFVWFQLQPNPKPSPMDLFASSFRPIRRWARYGEPNGTVRPVVRMPSSFIVPEWEPRLWEVEQHCALELRLFGDWFVVSLTSADSEVQDHLKRWCAGSARAPWLIGDTFGPLTKSENTGAA
jgi:HNH endonuclease